MLLLFWGAVFFISLLLLVKGSGWFLEAAEKIGLKMGLSSFLVGVLIVGFGTSLPELISSIIALTKGVPEVVVSTAVGSNIANILFIVGLSVLISKKITVSKDLIDSELPMLAISTVIFLFVAYGGDRMITSGESVFLIVAYLVYLFYSIYNGGEGSLPERWFSFLHPDKLFLMDVIKLIVGIVGLLFGAQYLIEALVNISIITKIAPGIISLTAVALGTSLPELIVSLRAGLAGKSEVVLGNIFGSNAFNLLIVVGVPGLLSNIGYLPIGEKTFIYGLPVMAAATFVFIISGISKNIYRWEGMMFLIFYALFIMKLFDVV